LTYDPTGSAGPQSVYTETTEVGFFERIGAALIGIPLGILLIFFPVALLWWNEHRNVEMQDAIDKALQTVATVPAATLAAANEGHLVHVVGTATASAVNDPTFAVTLPSMVAVQRQVEMYQWREQRQEKSTTNFGGSQTTTTTTRYDKVWSTDWQDSSTFLAPQGHRNPPMPAPSALLAADDAKLGAFRLGATTLAALVETTPPNGNKAWFASGFQEVRPDKAPTGFAPDPAGGLYHGKDPADPAVGDVRLRYAGVPAGKTLTVVARQSGEGFTDFPIARDTNILLAAVGEYSAETLLDREADAMATLTWIMRLVGVIVMWIGFMLLLGPFATLVSVLPFLGTLAEGLTADIAFVLALILGGVTIAVAWLFVHPLVSIALIVATLVVGSGYIYLRRG
jgi:hypothetical protein